MSNREERCQRCCGFDADSGECTAYRPWGFDAMEEDGCTFFNFHEDRRMKMCTGCKYFEFSETIGSPHEKVWHCRDGFTPSKDCKDMAAYNDKCRKAYYRKYPNELQLKIRF